MIPPWQTEPEAPKPAYIALVTESTSLENPLPYPEPGSPLDYALKYAALGWRVFPVWGAKDGKCRCGNVFCKSPGKHPVGALVARGMEDATTDPAIIRRWWTKMPDAGIGINLGLSGLVCIDQDPRNGSRWTMEILQIQHGELVSDVFAWTQGGGTHHVFSLASDTTLNLPGKLGDGVDVKRNGYIVVEPTIGPLGAYSWDEESNPLQGAIPSPLPDWIRDLSAPPAPTAVASVASRYATQGQLDELRDALSYLDADDRDRWIKFGMALRPLGAEGWKLWDDWSKKSDKYSGQDANKTWTSFKPVGAVNFESIFYAANQVGWINPLAIGAESFTPDPERVAILLEEVRAPTPEPSIIRQDAIIPIPLLQEIADWIGGLYESPTHDISQAAALALASVTGGRIYRSTSANWSSMMYVVSGASGVGKNYIKIGIERILMHAGLTRMIAGDFYTHQSAIYWALRNAPTHICISDEFGENFMEARKNNNTNKLTVFKSLKKVFSDSDHIFKPESYAMGGMTTKQREDNEMGPIINPSLTLIGLTTPWQFFSEIKTAHIESGLINRFVIVNVDDGKQVHGKQNSDVPPAYLVEEVKRVRRVNDVLLHSAYDMAPPAIIVKINDDAHDVFNAMKERQAEACGALEHATMDAMPRRWRENAMRMATALAPWHDHSRPIITGEIAAWCCEYVEHWGHVAIDAIRQQSGQNDYQSDMNKVLHYIREAKEGVTDSDLSYRFRTIKRREMVDIKSHLSEAELIVQAKSQPGAQGGRPSVRWYATKLDS